MFFQTKKIKLETLPEYLKAIRLDLDFSQPEIALKAGISVKVLIALEEGLFERLPSTVYAKGFLGKLAEIYHIDKTPLIKQFEIERKISSNINRNSLKPREATARFNPGWVITPKNLSFAFAAGFAAITVIYIIWQVLAIGKVPPLEITSPQNFSVIEKSFVEISGRTDPGAAITINNQPVFVDSQGKFTSQVSLSPGSKELVIIARNRFNKSITKTLNVISQNTSVEGEEKKVKLELEFAASVNFSYKIDGDLEVRDTGSQGDRKILEAKKQILFSTENAGRVWAKINGKNLGTLGREGEVLTDIPFFAESDTIK
ncbi:MAG: helix-turn-helix domain-containing protein [Patescibacteria group bacterium]